MPVIADRPSTAHWLFPPIIMGVLIFLLIIMLVKRAVKCVKEKSSFFPKPDKPFLTKNWDKLRLAGTLVLFAAYIFAMRLIGFLPASIILMLLYNFLYSGFGFEKREGHPESVSKAAFVRPILVSLANSIISSTVIWFLFSQVFKITLP
jgi:hypothetical protein